MNTIIIERIFFIPVILLVIVLTAVSSQQVSSQEKISTSPKFTPVELAIQELESAVKSTTTQEDLAKRSFDSFQEFEYIVRFPLSYEVPTVIPTYSLKDQPNFNDVLDLIEEKWLSFPIDDYYDEVGIFLLHGNIIVGRFDRADALFTKMNTNLLGKNIDPYFFSNSVMEVIYRINFCKEPFATREDLSLLYAAKMVLGMYEYQRKWDNKYWGILKLVIDNYKGTKGAELLSTVYECRKAELKYGSYEFIPEEERKQLKDNAMVAVEEMRKMCKE